MRIIYKLLFLFTVVSCNVKETNQKSERTFTVDKSIVENMFMWPRNIKIDDCIKLESNDTTLMGSVKKVVVHNDVYYFLDNKNKSISMYNDNGKFISKIGKQGNGPTEYVEIRDFCISTDGKSIFILDYMNTVEYNIETGNYVEKMKIKDKINPIYFICFEDNVRYFWNGTARLDNDKNCLFRDSDGNLTGLLENPNYILETDRFVKKRDGKYLLVPPHGDFNVYEISKDKMTNKYTIDFGDLSLPTNIITTKINIDEIDKNKYFKRLINVQETNDWLYVVAIGPEREYYELLFDKNGQKSYVGRYNSDNNFWIVASDENSFYALVEPLYIINASEKSILYSLKDMKISEFDNPLLIKFSF